MRYYKQALLLIMIYVAGLILSGCGGSSGAATDTEKNITIPVELARVFKGDIAAHFSGTAILEALEETAIVPKTGGIVKDILVEEGDYVKPGQVLARLDDEKIAVQVAQARASFEKLQNQILRDEKLFKKNLISAEAFQQSKTDFEVQKATYELARLELEYTAIRSPIGGVVSNRMIKTGNMVTTVQSIFQITDLDPLLAILHVPEARMNQLEKGHVADVMPSALPGRSFKGRIIRISPIVDPSSGTVKVTISIDDRSGELKPGMFTRVNIIQDVRKGAILAPKSAILREDRETRVFVVRDSMAFERVVTLGYMNTVNVEVLHGLDAGDLIVTIGKSGIMDSTLVEAVGNSKSLLLN
ncbi:efflux RND transporter periplasmic adaptor subunit [bacterium]|nr:efflux RND transporter periplasmic adaptor subunit [bacterium]